MRWSAIRGPWAESPFWRSSAARALSSGIVISAIQGRDYARLYVKDVVDGAAGSVELTPEERQAVDRAMA